MFVRIVVTPHARKESFSELGTGKYTASVKEKAEGNQANVRVLALLAQHLHVPKNKLRIKTGHKSRNKTIEVI